ncbi:MAG: anion permease [Zetaproteobacteria bacterium]|nr:anion permease [Zetaproteobacteria bacterium]
MHAWVISGIFIAVFVCIYIAWADRLVAVTCGAIMMLLYGWLFDFYSVQEAVDSVSFETLGLLLSMSMIAAVLERAGFFIYVGNKVVSHAQGQLLWVLIIMTLATYVISSFMNNLAAMMVMVPMGLSLCLTMKVNPAPLLMLQLVASNLGGASSMVGDFPNMIIASAGELQLFDFVGGMMAPSLVLLAVTLVVAQRKLPLSSWRNRATNVDRLLQLHESAQIDLPLIKVGLWIVVSVVVGFLLVDLLDVRPVWIAMIGAFYAAMIVKPWQHDWFRILALYDVLFFFFLFMMVGGLVSVGILDHLVMALQTMGMGIAGQLILFMVMAALVTLFLNAGPATAFFIPVAVVLSSTLSTEYVWWALSLGVLAGSSATITGATAGPITLSYYERFMEKHPEMANLVQGEMKFGFYEYLSWGLPLMAIFLAFSSLYILMSV